jgi:lipopolysaccharide transport system ATP-binding protein
VAFAEIEKFLDTPVKRYSSGMYVRLAFAVAAHLEPEILLVDEVLAVGEAQFQKKCLGKIGDVAREGRTVLFVSHNMGAIARLCKQGILLSRGRIQALGNIEHVMQTYIGSGSASVFEWKRDESGKGNAFFTRIYLGDDQGRLLDYVTTATRLMVYMDFKIKQPIRNLKLQFILLDGNGDAILASNIEDAGLETPSNPGIFHACVMLPEDFLGVKTYGVRAILWIPTVGECDNQDALRFFVEEDDSLSTSMPEGRPGIISIYCDWSLSERVDKGDSASMEVM